MSAPFLSSQREPLKVLSKGVRISQLNWAEYTGRIYLYGAQQAHQWANPKASPSQEFVIRVKKKQTQQLGIVDGDLRIFQGGIGTMISSIENEGREI